MQAYKKQQLDEYFLVEEAKTLFSNKFIDKSQLLKIQDALLKFKTNDNLLVRIAFFLLGAFLYSSIIGAFLVLFIEGLSGSFDQILLFVYAIIGLIGSELLAKNNFFRHGLDDAFILGFQLCLCIAIGVVTNSLLLGFVTMLFVGLFCSIRYLHVFSIVIACLGLVSFVFNLVVEHKVLQTMYLPFIGFCIALILFFLSGKIKEQKVLSHYKEAAKLMYIFSLLLGYFSMNYMVVRELSFELMQIVVTPNTDIPFAFLFYSFTFSIPIFYVLFSLVKKDRIMLWVGLFTQGYSIFTIRFYYSVLPAEFAMTIGGIILFITSFLAIKQWKNKTEGITFQPDRSGDSKLLRNAQMLIITAQSKIDLPAPKNDMPFGGGGFSGGGSGDTY